MRRLMAALCLRLRGLLYQAEVSRDLALPSSTVQRYLNLLDVSYQVVRVPGYSVNRTRRLIKAPKVYWTNTGLAVGEESPARAFTTRGLVGREQSPSRRLPPGILTLPPLQRPEVGRRHPGRVRASWAEAISTGSSKVRARKSMPTGSTAGTGPTLRLPPGAASSRTWSYACVVKPAGTVTAGNPRLLM